MKKDNDNIYQADLLIEILNFSQRTLRGRSTKKKLFKVHMDVLEVHKKLLMVLEVEYFH